MIRNAAARLRLPALLATAAILTAAGCTPDHPAPEPTLRPAPTYRPVPRDLCARMHVPEIATRFELDMSPRYEPSTLYSDFYTLSGMGCVIETVDETGRFTTTAFGGFTPGGVNVTVYGDRSRARASEAYRGGLRSWTRLWPDAPVTAIEGWWDEGTSVEKVERLSQGSLRRDPHASDSQVDYFVYHENLFLHVYINATTVNGEVDEALPILYGLVDALVEEARSHLTLVESG